MCLAVPGRITAVDDAPPLLRRGKVDFGGLVKEVHLAFVPEAAAGDYVLVHVGFAIARVDEREAARMLEHLREIEELAEFGEAVDPGDPMEAR